MAIHLEAYQLILLRRPAVPTEYDDETSDRIQRDHLAFYAALRRSGQVLTNGPMHDQPDDALRGLAFYAIATIDEARALAMTDPAVQAGRLEVEAMTYLCAPGTMIGAGVPVVLAD
jgi:uncharacterized protein YciI